jgi:hypothetical protein
VPIRVCAMQWAQKTVLVMVVPVPVPVPVVVVVAAAVAAAVVAAPAVRGMLAFPTRPHESWLCSVFDYAAAVETLLASQLGYAAVHWATWGGGRGTGGGLACNRAPRLWRAPRPRIHRHPALASPGTPP